MNFFFFFADIQELTSLSLISATFDNSGENHTVTCLVNRKYVAQITISKTGEPSVKRLVLIDKEDGLGSNEISHIVSRDIYIYCVSELLILCILFIKSNTVKFLQNKIIIMSL